MDWNKFLSSKGVEIKTAAFGLGSVEKSSSDHLKEAEAEIQQLKSVSSFVFPENYSSFATQIGGGNLGRTSIFCPTSRVWFPDPRFHNLRLTHNFSQPEYKPAHNFPMLELIVFAQDKEEDLWFAWKASELSKGNEFVYCFDEQLRAPPPKKVAENFVEFVSFCSLKNRITKLGLKKHTEDARKIVDEPADDWSDDEEDTNADDPLAPPKIFRPFANNPMM
eukprot:TRINITY_DN10256_c0_g1_i1.p1 TRINITY_DN10256_c0_g1~~TRINITY_DN10256_c0_g1_i1.p1  ORF type:complete len:221 (+),score=58.71 TRINITY_DN10256_c0_g1_i1:1-663(+)